MIIVAAIKVIGIELRTVFLELVLLSLLVNGHGLVVFNNRVDDISALRCSTICAARGRLNISPEEAVSALALLPESAGLIGMHWCLQFNPVEVGGLVPSCEFLKRLGLVAYVSLADRTCLSRNGCRR